MNLFPHFISLAVALVGLAGCQTTHTVGAKDPRAAVLTGEDCPLPEYGGILLWTEEPSLEVGENVSLTPYYSEYPGMLEELPAGCLGELTSAPDGTATFSRTDDGQPVATITDQAQAGKSILISAKYAGRVSAIGRASVFDPQANPLVGTWQQTASADCSGDSVILELVFRGDGSFSVTWRPFEAYRDYWGTYAYDAITGELVLTPEGGNYVPKDISSGKVSLSERQLSLGEGMSFGSSRQGEACSAPFGQRH